MVLSTWHFLYAQLWTYKKLSVLLAVLLADGSSHAMLACARLSCCSWYCTYIAMTYKYGFVTNNCYSFLMVLCEVIVDQNCINSNFLSSFSA